MKTPLPVLASLLLALTPGCMGELTYTAGQLRIVIPLKQGTATADINTNTVATARLNPKE